MPSCRIGAPPHAGQHFVDRFGGVGVDGDGVVEIDMIFEPRLKVGQQLSVISGTEKRFAGTYKVMGFTHRGMISSSMDAPCITTVVLWAAGKFTTVHGVPANKGI